MESRADPRIKLAPRPANPRALVKGLDGTARSLGTNLRSCCAAVGCCSGGDSGGGGDGVVPSDNSSLNMDTPWSPWICGSIAWTWSCSSCWMGVVLLVGGGGDRAADVNVDFAVNGVFLRIANEDGDGSVGILQISANTHERKGKLEVC